MAGGIVETNPKQLALNCDHFKDGAKKLYESEPNKGDMWFFELYHHLTDCADALRRMSSMSGR